MSPDGTPLCTGCGRPVGGSEYYCPHCGTTVSNRTPYLPYVNIRHNYAPFGSVWEDIDKSRVRGWKRVMLYVLFGLLFAPFFVIASPFILAEWVRNRRQRRRADPRKDPP